MKLIIFGAPGAGKGTVSDILARTYKLKHISMGEVIRKEIEKKTDLGNKIEPIVDSGKLIPNILLEKLLLKVIPNDNFILDGSPRRVTEKKFLDNLFIPDYILYLDVSKKVILSRLESRSECPKCNKIYGKDFKPKKQGYCDKDNTKLERRQDDNPKIIATRFDVYNKETKPVLREYGRKVIKINGNRTPELILRDIRKIIK